MLTHTHVRHSRLHQHRGEKEHSHHHGSSGANGGAGSTNGGSREAAIANRYAQLMPAAIWVD